MKLHTYQKNCLAALRRFLKAAAAESPESAFVKATEEEAYHPAHQMEDVPFVCLRIPTGGGKTLIAAHAVGVVADAYMHTESPLCLWITPSESIMTQTLKSLKNERHPCHRALSEAFEDSEVHCMSMREAMRAGKDKFDGSATVVVCTWQSFHQESTERLKVYEDNGALMSHFENLTDKEQESLERHADGEVCLSLANALRLRRPLVIEDEAHNARGQGFYRSLARFHPSCFLEFTATPELEHLPAQDKQGSNVLYRAMASELKKAGMIKLPIHLQTCDDWGENIRAAVVKRDELEKLAKENAKKGGQYIRPIALYQAENKNLPANIGAVRAALLNDFGEEFDITADQIAVYSSDKKELKDIDLLAEGPVRHIITVQALAEGWDCSFAYVLCTMANLRNSKPVEQVLGRILRMPHATPNAVPELNQSYAFSTYGNFRTAAHALKDALVEGAGFGERDAQEAIATPQPLFESYAPANKGLPPNMKPLSVPMLAVRESGRLEFCELADCLDVEWSIARETPDMSKFSPPDPIKEAGNIDAVKSELRINRTTAACRAQLILLESDKAWTEAALAAWLDANISHPDIPQNQSSPYMLAAVRRLCEKHDMKTLARHRFYLKAEIKRAVAELRRRQYKKGCQRMLDNVGDGRRLEVSPECALEFAPEKYKPHWVCDDPGHFNRHLFDEVGELKSSGEEFKCASFLDTMPNVEVWVRNLDKRDNSFWLQTSLHKFYPDFVCRLTDGRIMAVEYKGYDRWSDKKSTEKRDIGEIWERLSGGKCLFVMPQGPNDLSAIEKCASKKKA